MRQKDTEQRLDKRTFHEMESVLEDIPKISTRRVPGRGSLPGYKEETPPILQPIKKLDRARKLSEIKMERVQFFWKPYVPIGKITLLGGDPGMGKSFISAAIAADVSQGRSLPGQGSVHRDPMNVLIFAGEDSPEDTLKPRLMSLRADQDRVHIYDGDLILDEEGLRVMQREIEQTQAKLVIIDPIVAFLGAKMDMNRANEVRARMKAIAKLGADNNAAIIVVRHLRKQSTNGTKSKDIYNGAGSIDFTAAVRSELQVSEGKDGTLYLNHIKSNVGPKGDSISYAIDEDEFQWGEIVDKIAIKKASRITTTFKNEKSAREWLFLELRDHPDGRPSKDIDMAAAAAGISVRALKAAAGAIAKYSRMGGSNGYWVLTLKPPGQINMGDEAELKKVNGYA